MRLPRPHGPWQWTAAVGAALLVLGGAFWLVAPYNIAASIPHAPGVRPLLHGYLYNAVRTWSLGSEPPAGIELDDPALVALGAGHYETGCAPCHGAPGRSRNPTVRGMRPEPPDLTGAVGRFADRELHWIVLNGFKYTGMPAWPAQERPDEPWALAAFLRRYDTLDPTSYIELAYGPVRPRLDAAAVSFGGPGARLGETVDNCARCHGRDGQGRNGTAPKLAGQPLDYLQATLEGFATGARPSGFMQPIAAALSATQRQALAEHYAGLPAFTTSVQARDATLVARGAALASRGDARTDVPSCMACHGPGRRSQRRAEYPNIAGQDERWLRTWLRRWREFPLGGTSYAPIMHVAAQTLTDEQIAALSAYFAAGAPEPGEAPRRLQ